MTDEQKYRLRRHIPSFVSVDINPNCGTYDTVEKAQEHAQSIADTFREPCTIEWKQDNDSYYAPRVWGKHNNWVLFYIDLEEVWLEIEAKRQSRYEKWKQEQEQS